jgi:hypothetical protein
MNYSIKNIATTNQIAYLTGYTGSYVRLAITEGRLTTVQPFPDTLKKTDKSGQIFILCDELLEEFLIGALRKSRFVKENPKYHPLKEAKKVFEFI